jgi:hypothetical protein
MNDKTLSRSGIRAIMLFIAELNGYKEGTVKGKLSYGMMCYMKDRVPALDLSTEHDRSELNEVIWLERVYAKLDSISTLSSYVLTKHKQRLMAKAILNHMDLTREWDIPIELDASASVLQYLGVLLGETRLLEETNVHGKTLRDPWQRGMNRTMFKHAATPLLYGSSRACHELWQSKGHKYTLDDIKAFNAELSDGSLGVANLFKEFIINNVKPKETMTVKIIDQEFTIECNRFRNVGEKTTTYEIYDSVTDSVRRIHHTDTTKVADLEQFRRYFVTLLVHSADSWVADKVVKATIERYGFCLDIHDAFLVHPRSAQFVRREYAKHMQYIYDNRKQILSDYFSSIGIGAEAQLQWEQLMAKVVPVTNFKARYACLK